MTFMRRALLPLILSLLPLASLAASADGETHHDYFTSVAFGLILALIVTLWAAPRFYNRALRKKGDKNLTRFLMNDPRMRDAILEARTGKKPGAKAEGPAPKEDPKGP
jgi:hypothetical protein